MLVARSKFLNFLERLDVKQPYSHFCTLERLESEAAVLVHFCTLERLDVRSSRTLSFLYTGEVGCQKQP